MGKKGKKKGRLPARDKKALPSPKSVSEDTDLIIDNVETEALERKERKSCPHFDKGFDIAKVSGKLNSNTPCRCEDCREGMADRRGAKGKVKLVKKKGDVSKAIWICLQCGHFSCGGVGLPGTLQSHAARHHRQTRHPLVIQWENSNLRWCFQCDRFFPSEIIEENGVKRDVLLNVVKLMKSQVLEMKSVDSEDTWCGSGNATADMSRNYTLSDSLDNSNGYMVRGLINLGNTCFFNSVMQNLLAMKNMRDYFLNQDASFGLLSMALRKIFTETKSDAGSRGVMNPKSLFGCVCTKAPQFRGYQQQDSHELLRYLLDGLSTEELAAKKLDVRSDKSGVRLVHNPTFVDSTFGGQVSSTVTCMECGYASTVFEPFLDLSLPVSSKKPPAKRLQLSTRSRKTRLPPKRCGRFRAKVSNEKDPDTSLSASGQSGTSGYPIQTNSITLYNKECLSSEENAADSTCLDSVDKNAIGDQQCLPSCPKSDNEDTATMIEKTPDACYESSWMDFVEPGNARLGGGDQDGASENSGLAPYLNLDIASPDNSHMNSAAEEPDSMRPSEEEFPRCVSPSEVLILPYEEVSVTPIEVNEESETFSSVMDDGKEDHGLDGFSELFNEPESFSQPVAGPSFCEGVAESGFMADNSSESDLDEVDDTDNPVSVDSCLLHFIKPELLANDNAWECENCSRSLRNRAIEKREKNAVSSFDEVKNVAENNGGTYKMNLEQGGSTGDEQSNKDDTNTGSLSSSCESASNADDVAKCQLPSEKFGSYGQERSIGPAFVSGIEGPCENGYLKSNHETFENEESSDDEAPENLSKPKKIKRDATKRVLINKAPLILTIHLKRFSQDARGRLSKLNGHVNFGEILNLDPYMDPRCPDKDKYVYRLLGVVEHMGTMRHGHYVAYVRGKADARTGGWYHVSDAHVRGVSFGEVLRSEAYILFYEKM